ncbi:hypothetical protein BDQ12DRAFT_694203 [Crucibulum laeve]|uniref:Plus3 domain-containing protein n=1 Tax=Crucibulum laeve TaxID=68775 RepID=A0A5C3LHM3_9AGAR|nr:hypothetical protein BDQ12DRAFT_694203 [Crucibulum laeve]
MSDFEDDIDDQLLALAGASEKKRKRRSGHSSSKSKKRKSDPMESDSDDHDSPKSEEEDSDPYPLEGKYKDEADRQSLLEMNEIRREEILAARADEKQKFADRRAVALLVKNQGKSSGDIETVAHAAKREHKARGATKEKYDKLRELKEKRKTKYDKTTHHSPRREHSSSPMDTGTDEDESEDGIITKEEQQEEKERKLLGKDKLEPEDELVTRQDLERCRLTRDAIAKHCMAPWFEDYITHAWVRYLIGAENGQPVYRICEVKNLAADLVKPYKINDKTVNQAFELKHGKSVRNFTMDKVSNAPFTEREWDRLTKTFITEDLKLPTKRTVDDKIAQMQKLATQPMTESDINAMLARKQQLQGHKPSGLTPLERSRFIQERTLALRRHDYKEVAEIEAKLAEYADTPSAPQTNSSQDMLAKVNERNRKANQEAVRKAEIAEAERKRRERKLAASGVAVQSTNPSARLKTVPRMFGSSTPISRPGTPATPSTKGGKATTPVPPSALSGGFTTTGKSLEASIIDSLEIDLGDF